MPITAGKVTYSRTVQVRQFEPRKVDIEVSFTVEGKEKLADLYEQAGTTAREECLALVSIRDRE